jgi:FHS family glucose/mannose:H+ symporter-like MFS transporter
LVVGIRAVPDIPGNITSWTQVPMGVWAIPLTGLFFAPLYPMMCSVILSSLPVNKHAPMTGLIMVFSVLGGTSGSFSVGRLFDAIGGNYAYWILPLSSLLMLFAFSALKKQLN